jgi:hypothetical protein
MGLIQQAHPNDNSLKKAKTSIAKTLMHSFGKPVLHLGGTTAGHELCPGPPQNCRLMEIIWVNLCWAAQK